MDVETDEIWFREGRLIEDGEEKERTELAR
jgi:hypothetical protein